MSRYLISVIIPTYNDAKYIKYAIDSVINQSFREFEIIVIDDGSTDNTQSVLSQYIKENKIRYFYQENKGVAAARNKGILEAKGRYISFLDADDLYLNNTLEKRVNFITQFNLKFIVTDFYVIESENDLKNLDSLCPVLQKRGFLDFFNKKNDIDSKNYLIIDRKTFAQACLKYIPPKLTTVLLERDILIKNKIFFDPRLHRAEDLDFIWKIIAYGGIDCIGILKEPTYLYMFNRATHHKHTRYKERLIYYDNMINNICSLLSKKDIAKRIYEDYWTIYQKASLNVKLLLLKRVLSLDPFNLIYWKSLLSLFLKNLIKSQ